MLFCSLAVFEPRVGHTIYVLSPFISVLYHSDWLFHGKSCPCLDVVHPGRAWPSSPACTWHCSLHSLSPGNSLVSSWCDHSMLASLLWRCLTVPFLLHCIADIVKSVPVWCWHTRYVIVSTRQSHCSPWSAGIQLSAHWICWLLHAMDPQECALERHLYRFSHSAGFIGVLNTMTDTHTTECATCVAIGRIYAMHSDADEP